MKAMQTMQQKLAGLARIALGVVTLAVIACGGAVRAETCTTQSGMSDTERDALATAAKGLALKVQANDMAGLKASTIAEFAKDFGGIQYLASVTARKLAGGAAAVEQVYLLDATTLKRNADGTAADAQFFCSLNRTTMETDFLIPALPPGRYGFAMVNIAGQAVPWRLSFLMRQDAGAWLLAGFYPKAMTAAGHDGVWYWTQARQMVKDKQPWNAYLFYQAAQMLLRPADFVLSTHLDKLHTEAGAAAPAVLSDGVSVDAPLVVKGKDGAEYHFTGLGVDDSLGKDSVDIVVHLSVEATLDAAAAKKRNDEAVSALLAAYPEMRKPFHGVWIYAEVAGQSPFATEQAMSEIR